MDHSFFVNGYALIAGVGADLPITAKDATALSNLLTDPTRAAYPRDQVTLLTEAAASRNAILDAVDNLAERASKDSNATVIVYFSGHGGRVEHPTKPPEYFLVPYGYDPSRRSDTAISGSEFTVKIEKISARKLVVILDCCHAAGIPALKELGETFVKTSAPIQLLNMLETGSGRVVITSSREKEFSYTGSPYSVFTTCLLEAMNGSSGISKDGFVRILDVLIYLFEHVPKRASGPQHPFVKKIYDLSDNFPLCYCAGGSQVLRDNALSSYKSPVKFLTVNQRLRLEKQLEALQPEWNKRNEKIGELRTALAIESGVAIKFQLEQQILVEESKLARLGDELNRLEQGLQ